MRTKIFVVWLSAAAAVLGISVVARAVLADQRGLAEWANRAQIVSVLASLLIVVVQGCLRVRQKSRLDEKTTAYILRQLRSLALHPPGLILNGAVTIPDSWPVPWQLARTSGNGLWDNYVDGDVRDLAEHLASSADRNCAVLGDSGSGKTMLGTLILQTHLDAHRRAKPEGWVPVRLHLASWNAKRLDFTRWAAAEIKRECLRSGEAMSVSRDVLAQFLTQRHVLLLLDGFDELPTEQQAHALRKLASSSVYPYILFSQPDPFYTAAHHLHAHIEVLLLRPLLTTDASRVLRRTPSVHASNWADLADELGQDADSDLARTLRTPLFLDLVRYLIVGGLDVPSGLKACCSREQAERLILAEFIEMAVESEATSLAGPGIASPTAIKWLAFIAATLKQRKQEVFVWWDLGAVVPWWIQSLVLSVACSIALQVSADALWFMGLQAKEQFSILDANLAGALVAMYVAYHGDARERTQRSLLTRTAVGRVTAAAFVSWFVAILWAGLSSGRHSAFFGSKDSNVLIEAVSAGAFSSVLVLASFFGYRAAREEVASVRLPRWIHRLSDWIFRPRLPTSGAPRVPGWTWSVRTLAWSAALGVPCSLVVMLSAIDFTQEVSWLRYVAGAVTVTGLLYLPMSFGVRRSGPTVHPGAVALLNPLYGALKGLMWAGALVYSVLLLTLVFPQSWHTIREALQQAFAAYGWFVLLIPVVYLLIPGTPGAVVGLLVTQGSRFAAALLWLRLTRRFTMRPFRFLRWAHDRGLLRSATPGWAFRHARLEELLLERGSRVRARTARPRDTTIRKRIPVESGPD